MRETATLLATTPTHTFTGLLRSARYAFGPNRLHYCGPDANAEILAHLQHGAADPNLESLLKGFRTMYPYLRLIADSNRIRDAFDERVVEAYWLGNELLENVEKQQLWRHLIEKQEVKKRIGPKEFATVEDKIRQAAVPHHSFHVLDIWKRTGHLEREHALESLDSCRISWGTVRASDGPKIIVETAPLRHLEGKLQLGEPIQKAFTRPLEAETDIEQLKVDDIVSMHWGVLCEVITPRQAATLKRYTLKHLALANQTI
ncbi:hypothetical protein HYW67_02540 [Candidatus Parcubacteria bacterium]|nr:hypothetical protein [Candidatus Parcubacteria bacterium]